MQEKTDKTAKTRATANPRPLPKTGVWSPWRGCHKCSAGCKFCYIHKGDAKRGIDTNVVTRTDKFYAPIDRNKKGEYKYQSGRLIYLCFSSDFLLADADCWRQECWQMMKQRSDLTFLFLTKRIDRLVEVLPDDWGDGYDNVIIGCGVEDQATADYRLPIFLSLPIKHRNIICQPMLEAINLSPYLKNVDLVVIGGESDANARPLDFAWVLDVRAQCVQANVPFNFRQCGTHFIKDGITYTLPVRQLMSQARKAAVDFLPTSPQ